MRSAGLASPALSRRRPARCGTSAPCRTDSPATYLRQRPRFCRGTISRLRRSYGATRPAQGPPCIPIAVRPVYTVWPVRTLSTRIDRVSPPRSTDSFHHPPFASLPCNHHSTAYFQLPLPLGLVAKKPWPTTGSYAVSSSSSTLIRIFLSAAEQIAASLFPPFPPSERPSSR